MKYESVENGINCFEIKLETLSPQKFEIEFLSIDIVYNPFLMQIAERYDSNRFYESQIYEKKIENIYKTNDTKN